MKKYFLIMITAVLFSCQAFAQRGTYTVTVTPSSFTVEDSITIDVDLSGSPDMAGKDAVYIWIFANGSSNGEVNSDGEWTNSKDRALMKKTGTNKWQFGLVPINMWPNVAPGDLKKFAFLIKLKDGSKQTDNSPEFNFDPLVFIETTYLTFPDKVGQDDVITLYFNQNLSTNVVEQRMTPTTITISAFDATTAVGPSITGTLKPEGNKRYSFTLIPTRSFGNVAGGIKKLRYTVKGSGKDADGNTIAVSGVEQEKILFDVK
jgi:hypothetical protein